MGLQPLEILCRRQILTYRNGPRIERVNVHTYIHLILSEILSNMNDFNSLEVVDRVRETHIQVG